MFERDLHCVKLLSGKFFIVMTARRINVYRLLVEISMFYFYGDVGIFYIYSENDFRLNVRASKLSKFSKNTECT